MSARGDARRAFMEVSVREPPRLLLNMKTLKTEWEIIGSKKSAPLASKATSEAPSEAVTEKMTDPQINDDLKLRTTLAEPHVEKVYDEDLRGFCYEIGGPGVQISLPSSASRSGLGKPSLEIHSGYLLILAKDLGCDYAFELSLKDSQSVIRKVRFVSSLSTKIRNSQFTYNLLLPAGRTQWQLYYLDLQVLMRNCFNQEFRVLHTITISATLRIKAVYSTNNDPAGIPSAQLLQSLLLNHWPNTHVYSGAVGALAAGEATAPMVKEKSPPFVFLSALTGLDARVTRTSARGLGESQLVSARSVDASVTLERQNSINTGLHQRPQTQGDETTSTANAASSAADLRHTTANTSGRTAAGLRADTHTHEAAAAPPPLVHPHAETPWEQELYATIDLGEPLPPRKVIDSQNEEVWTPSLDAVIEEDHRNTADTLGGDDESVGSEGEIRKVAKTITPQPAPPVRRHGVAACKTIL